MFSANPACFYSQTFPLQILQENRPLKSVRLHFPEFVYPSMEKKEQLLRRFGGAIPGLRNNKNEMLHPVPPQFVFGTFDYFVPHYFLPDSEKEIF